MQVFIVSDLDLILASIHLNWRNGAIELIKMHEPTLSIYMVIKIGFLYRVFVFDLSL